MAEMTPNIPLKSISYRKRDCDICGNPDLKSTWKYPYSVRTSHYVFGWQVHIVICKKCGFVFTSPAPEEKSLEEYYGDGLGLFNQQILDYSIEKRIALIRRHAPPGGTASYVEIGSNNCPELLQQLKSIVGQIKTVELIEECTSDHHNMAELPSGTADILTAYFVLEHVPNPRKFLQECHRILADNGTCIIEVPNLHLYPKYTDALILWEHTNHFSPASLTALVGQCGFDVLETSQDSCSRTFGFAAVLKKSPKPAMPELPDEYQSALSCMEKGLEKHRKFEAYLASIREKIARLDSAGKISILWAANNVCQRLLEGFPLPANAHIVDINQRKRELFKPIPVSTPESRIGELNGCRLLIINSARHKDEIIKWIRATTGNDLADTEIIALEL